MTNTQVRVTFQPSGRTAFVLPDTRILEAAACVGLTIDTPCGGTGTCGNCRVRLMRGACAPSEADRQLFREEELRDGWRLGCQATVETEAVVQVPDRSLFAGQHQILRATTAEAVTQIQPAVRKTYLEMPPPTLTDSAADVLRLEQHLGTVTTDLALLRRLPSILRKSDFKGTAVLSDHRLIDFESGDTTADCYAAAFDIGTTTLVGCLLDLVSGKEMSLVSRVNSQVNFGDDVLSRIRYADGSTDQHEQLRSVIVAEITSMIDQLCTAASVSRKHLYTVAFAGNTTMEHLLCGIDCNQLGQVPFSPAFGRGLWITAEELGIPIHDRGLAYVFPVVGGFVGGDTVAGMLATQLVSQAGPTLLVDLGTNGEIVLAHNGQTWAASTAAGPAFEGARISCGMRATEGAIEKVAFAEDIQCNVIGNRSPIGLCGSGLVDLGAELLNHGIISPEGRMRAPEELAPRLSTSLRRRVCRSSGGTVHFLLTDRDPGGAGSPVILTQKDVRELQLACGAIRAGIKLLLKQAELQPPDLQSVLIAGGFGCFIRCHNAQRIGLLPPDVDPRRVHFVGNVSLAGAKWSVLSTQAREQAEALAHQTLLVQLSTDQDFFTEFADAMIFPQSE